MRNNNKKDQVGAWISMEDWDCSVSISTLICNEDQTILDTDDDDDDPKRDVEHGHSNPLGSEDEYIESLVSKETCLVEARHCDKFCSWLKWARSDAIQWIMKTATCLRFSRQTAYLAITYYDRFLTQRSMEKEKSWVVRLLSIACLSLAAKMEECAVPALSEYQSEGRKFDGNTIQRMELLVLSTLEWRMDSVTPFAYLSCFTSRLQIGHESKELVSKSVGFIFAIVDDVNLVEHRASTIAAAAVLAASNRGLNKRSVESKLGIFSPCANLESEHVFSCYAMMTESEGSRNCINRPRSNKRRRLQLDNNHEKKI